MTSDLTDWTAVRLAAGIAAREVSAREVVAAHLDRIAAVNGQVNAVVTLVAERAMAEAARADEELARGGRVGPLHGLPVVVKDTHLTAGIRTTFGSPLYRDHVPDEDELVVRRIRDAGAIVLGKSNAPEFGAGSHTFNEVFGATRNPYDLTRSAGGSSGGAAVAVACGFAALADGSDMGGSLRNPASFDNVVGLRPSPGRVPTYPQALPYSMLTTQGPIGRTVDDAALMMSAIAGPDPRSPYALHDPGSVFRPPLDRPPGRMRVAFSVDFGGALPVDAEVRDVLRSMIPVLESLGWSVREAHPDLSGAEEAFRTLRALEFDAGLGAEYDAHPEAFAARIAWNIARGRALSAADVMAAEQIRGRLFHRMREFFDGYDLLICPAAQVPPFPVEWEYPKLIDGVPQDTYLDWMRVAYWISVTGCPALSLPAGFTPAGLPIGAQFVAPHRGDLGLLRAAAAVEDARPLWRIRPPVIAPGALAP